MSIDITDKVKYIGRVSYDGDNITTDNPILLEPRFQSTDEEINDSLTLNTFLFNSQDIQAILPCEEWYKCNIFILDKNKIVLNENKINTFLNKIKKIVNDMSLNDMYNNIIIQFDNDKTFIFNHKIVKIKENPCDSNTYENNQIIF